MVLSSFTSFIFTLFAFNRAFARTALVVSTPLLKRYVTVVPSAASTSVRSASTLPCVSMDRMYSSASSFVTVRVWVSSADAAAVTEYIVGKMPCTAIMSPALSVSA